MSSIRFEITFLRSFFCTDSAVSSNEILLNLSLIVQVVKYYGSVSRLATCSVSLSLRTFSICNKKIIRKLLKNEFLENEKAINHIALKCAPFVCYSIYPIQIQNWPNATTMCSFQSMKITCPHHPKIRIRGCMAVQISA